MEGWYQQIYDIIVTYIYGGEALNSFQELVATEVATTFSMVAASVPILVILLLIKGIVWSR